MRLQQPEYMLGRTQAEHDRLARQGRLISKITRHFLEEMGLCPGMRVLDVGSGVGDVALLAARMVAPNGQVVGVDLDESTLQTARHRAIAEEVSNVQFHARDFPAYMSNGLFDAAVGRCVLLHQHDPSAALTSVMKHVPSGGIVAFQEPWFSRGFSIPKAPLFEEVTGWLHSTVRPANWTVTSDCVCRHFLFLSGCQRRSSLSRCSWIVPQNPRFASSLSRRCEVYCRGLTSWALSPPRRCRSIPWRSA